MPVVLSNNATSLLAAAISAADTTLSIENTDAGKFPNPATGDWFPLTIVDNAGNMEIVKATARVGAIITIERAQDGTTAKAFAAGARVDLRATVAALFGVAVATMAKSDDKETPDDGDFLGGVLADGSTVFKTPWGKIKKALQAFFDGRYLKLVGGTIQGILTVSGEGSQRGVFRNTGDGDSWINFYTRDQNWYSEFGQRANGAAYVRVNGQELRFQTDGSFRVPGASYSGGAVYAGGGSSRLDANGNIVGSIWNNFGASDAYTAINNRIETRAAAFANDRVAALAFRRVSHWTVAIGSATADYDAPAGAVVYGVRSWSGYKIDIIKFCYLQAYDPVRGWITFWG
ncbi:MULTISPECIES: hypothetical protein [unclassified Brucella]|uniref:hypothetical protein n=1 Tax=unclassified Brucella TaxID=2632610 RepID=UPI001FFE5D34|nr:MULTISPECIES: hypothetical protein [unclassified Brucella]